MNTASAPSTSTVTTTDSASAVSKPQTFKDLCEQLGRRMNGAENALICVSAYRAYLKEHPDTAHGKGNKSDRDQEVASFRKAAAEASGVSSATIDALLQVGKAIEPLSEDVKEGLRGSSLGIRMLRKLAPKKFNGKREELLKKFIEDEKVNADAAKAQLEQVLGTTAEDGNAKATTSTKSKAPEASSQGTMSERVEDPSIIENTYELVGGGCLDLQVGNQHVRVQVSVGEDGGIQVKTMTLIGSKEQMDRLLMKRTEAPTGMPAHTEVEEKQAA